jgi:glutamyl-tRNA synthetase
LIKELEENKIAYTRQKALQVCQLMKERVVFPQDFWQQGKYFFIKPEAYDDEILKTKWNVQTDTVLRDFVTVLKALEAFKADSIKATLIRLIAPRSIKIGQMMPVLRVALTGSGSGPDLMQSMELIGQGECVERIKNFLAEYLPS